MPSPWPYNTLRCWDSGKRSDKMARRPTPNAFVSVRVPSPSIRRGLEEVQKWMVQHNAEVRSALTPLSKLHITLSVIRLENEEEQERYFVPVNTRKCDE